MHNRFEKLQRPYLGFEGAFAAQKDGKVWLNNVNLLLPMVADFMIQEIRHVAFLIAREYDETESAWPVMESSIVYPNWRKRHERIAAFLQIFSGRDERFAYDEHFLPGGHLERRLTKEFEHEGYDPRMDPNGTGLWFYPIDRNRPLAAPPNMRLLNIWFHWWNADFYGLAASALSSDISHVLSGEPVKLDDPTGQVCGNYDRSSANTSTLTTHFNGLLCEWVAIFTGLESLNLDLAELSAPIWSDLQLYFAILARYPDELAQGNVTVIKAPPPDRWRRLDEIEMADINMANRHSDEYATKE